MNGSIFHIPSPSFNPANKYLAFPKKKIAVLFWLTRPSSLPSK